MTPRTPQEKKRLSLKKDRRNTYGESPHGTRKSIPGNKRRRIRVERRAAKVSTAAVDGDGIAFDSAFAKAELKRKTSWKKSADTPLKKVIAKKIERRKKLLKNPRKKKTKEKKITAVNTAT